jgi:hypothetical protein
MIISNGMGGEFGCQVAPSTDDRARKHRPSAYDITSIFTSNSRRLSRSILTHNISKDLPLASNTTHLNITTMEGRHHQHDPLTENPHQHNPTMENHLQQYEANTFRDFVTCDPHATIPVLGKRYTLDALDRTTSAGFHAQPVNPDHLYPAYTPLMVALNTICAEMNMHFVTEAELYGMQFMPWFEPFAKGFIRDHHAQHLINIDNFINAQGSYTEDHMVLCIAAFGYFIGCRSIGLGFVTLVKGQPVQAFHYPPTNTIPDYTAWIVADFRTDEHAFYGIGRKVDQEQCTLSRQEEDPSEHNGDVTDDEDAPNPFPTPRKTATRVLSQQVPLPVGLTAQDILQNHKSRLQYNNILKVALVFSNQAIWEECKSESLPKNERLKIASAIVKRINTAVKWIEKQYEIDTDAFRTVFDRERRTNEVNTRGKNEVNNAVIAANSLKIDSAMAWIRTGGPRPGSSDAPQRAAIATVSTANPGSHPGSSTLLPGHRTVPAAPPGYVYAPTTPASFQGPLTAPALTAPAYLGGFQITTDNDMGVNDLNGMDDSMMDLSEDLNQNPEDLELKGYFSEF